MFYCSLVLLFIQHFKVITANSSPCQYATHVHITTYPYLACRGGKGGKGGAPVVVVPDEPREPMVSGSSSVSAVSQAVCGAGAVAARKELYQHVAQLRYGEVQLLSLVYFVTKVLTVSMFSNIWSWFFYFEFIFFYFKHHNKKKLHCFSHRSSFACRCRWWRCSRVGVPPRERPTVSRSTCWSLHRENLLRRWDTWV